MVVASPESESSEGKLQAVKRHEAALRASIRLFRRNMETGIPLPDGLTQENASTQN